LTFSNENLAEKGCSLSFKWVKSNFITFPALEKSFWLLLEKCSIAFPGKILPTLMSDPQALLLHFHLIAVHKSFYS